MAVLKTKDIRQMNEKERNERIKELKMEVIKNKTRPGKIKMKEIKKAIARIITLNKSEKNKAIK